MSYNLVVGENGQVLLVDAAGNVPVKASGTPSGLAPMYGAGGLFGVPGVDPTLINACVGPMGVEKAFRWYGSEYESPMYDALSYIGSTGYTQTGMCSDCGTPSFKECIQSACFGRVCQMTNEHAFDELGLMMNRGVNRMAMHGAITDPAGNVLLAQGQQLTDRFTLDLIGAAYNLRFRVGQLMWAGNPSANVGGAWQFEGLALLINTGKFDKLTGIACPALDSYLANYNSNIVGVAGSPSIVTSTAGVARTLRYRLLTANFNPEDAITYVVMHPIHWDTICDAWACEYGLVCPNTNASAATRNDAMRIAEFRDDLMRRMVVKIDGKEYPVLLDNLIPLTTGSYGTQTTFCGDIYFLTTMVGGMEVMYGEFQNLQNTTRETLAWFRQMFGMQPISVTDGGRFAHAPTTSGGFCFDGRILTKPRIIAKMPWTSGRLRNVCVIPTGFYPDVTSSGGLYEREGGPSSKPYLGMYGNCGSLGTP